MLERQVEDVDMLYDRTYYLGEMFRLFLNDNPNLMDDFYTTLSGEAVSTQGVSTLLMHRFEAWLETCGQSMDSTYRDMLKEMVGAFAELLVTDETTVPWFDASMKLPNMV